MSRPTSLRRKLTDFFASSQRRAAVATCTGLIFVGTGLAAYAAQSVQSDKTVEAMLSQGEEAQRYLLALPTDGGNITAIDGGHITAEMPGGAYLLEYDDPRQAVVAASKIEESGEESVEIVSTFKPVDITEANGNSVEVEYGKDSNPIVAASEIISTANDSTEENSEHERPVIAVLDTGGDGEVASYSLTGTDARDMNGHGKEVIAGIRAAAPEAEIISIKVTDDSGFGDTASVYAGIKTAMALNSDIVNISLYAPRSQRSETIDAVIAEAREKGIDVVCAAGNDSADASGYIPASSAGAITVGTCDTAGHLASTSNFGDDVDVYVAKAPSTSIAAAEVTAFLASSWGYEDAMSAISSEYGKGRFYSDVLPSGEELVTESSSDIVSLPDDDPIFIGAATEKIKIATHTSGQVSYDSKAQSTCYRYTGAKVSSSNSRSENEKVGTIAFCVIPPKGGVANGYYNSTVLTKSRCSNKDSWYKVALAAMYYGYGGPGFNSTTKKWYPSKTYNGKTMTDPQRFGTSHILLSAIHLGGIKKTTVSSKYQTWFKKNVFNSSNLTSTSTYAGKLLAHYNDKDMVANGGYTMDEWAQQVYYMPTGGSLQDFMTYIPLKKNSLKLVKSSTRPKLTNSSSSYSLKGAVYGVYATKAAAQTHRADKALATYKTNANGAFTTPEVYTHNRTYYIAEITPSKGFALDNTVHAVVANKSKVKKVSSKEPVILKPVPVTLKAEKRLEGRPLKAGEFTFYLKDSNGKVLQTKTNDIAGHVVFDSISYDKTGTVNYTIVEKIGTDPNIEYDTLPQPVTVTVSDNGIALVASVVYGKTGNSNPGTFDNKYAVKGSVTVKKVDADDDSVKLRGAVFSVFEGAYASGEEAVSNGVLVKTGTSGIDGIAVISDLDIELGGTSTYTLVETKAPNGYYLDGDGDEVLAPDLHRYFRTFTLSEEEPNVDLSSEPARNPKKGPVVVFESRKVFENGELKAGDYTFELEALSVDDGPGPMPPAANGATRMTAVNDASGYVFFGKVKFSDDSYVDKTYKYRIREVIPDNQNGRIEYDATPWICEVKVRRSAIDESAIITNTKYYKDTTSSSGTTNGEGGANNG